ncbi:MAG TPA: hypothetical protein ENJ82_07185 [Bacteroidetes bacterium]|nr:hypothetical protein [Bacteroidota bacterium]
MNLRAHILILFGLLALSTATQMQAQRSNCHMTFKQMRPIIDRYNPFFTDHTWENAVKTETARMDPMRLLIIKQKACLRHHVLYTLHIDPSVIEDTDRFWITEILVLLKRVYFNDPIYIEYKKGFEKEYIRQFLAAGLNKTFTFPLNDRTFICRIERGDWGAKLRLEIVKFVFREKIKQAGIAREKDDGWFQGEQ